MRTNVIHYVVHCVKIKETGKLTQIPPSPQSLLLSWLSANITSRETRRRTIQPHYTPKQSLIMHLQRWFCLTLATFAHAAPLPQYGHFQAFNGYHCDGSNPGPKVKFQSYPSCIAMSGRHSFNLTGNHLPHGASVTFFETPGCDFESGE